MKRPAFILALLLARALAQAGDLGGSGLNFGAPTSLGSVTISTLTVTNNSDLQGNVTVGSQGGSKKITIGQGVGDSPELVFNKDNNGNSVIRFLDQGTGAMQIYNGSDESMGIRTDGNQVIHFIINGSDKMILDTSGRLNLGSTITNGNSLVNLSTAPAMFSVEGSTATGSNALASIATATPCGSNSVIGVKVFVSQPNGTSPVAYYLLGCPK